MGTTAEEARMQELRQKYAEQIEACGKYVIIKPVRNRMREIYRVELVVGVQGFQINEERDTMWEAEWMKIMLCNALYNLKQGLR